MVTSFFMVIGHRAGEAAIAYEHGADIEALMPKLRHSDYFTEPKVQELAAMERAEPGYCRRVADFVVGRKVRNFYCCCLYSCKLYSTAVVCLLFCRNYFLFKNCRSQSYGDVFNWIFCSQGLKTDLCLLQTSKYIEMYVKVAAYLNFPGVFDS